MKGIRAESIRAHSDRGRDTLEDLATRRHRDHHKGAEIEVTNTYERDDHPGLRNGGEQDDKSLSKKNKSNRRCRAVEKNVSVSSQLWCDGEEYLRR